MSDIQTTLYRLYILSNSEKIWRMETGWSRKQIDAMLVTQLEGRTWIQAIYDATGQFAEAEEVIDLCLSL